MQTINEITDHISYIIVNAPLRAQQAEESKADALAKLATYVDSSAIERLMRADAEHRVWSTVDRLIKGMFEDGNDVETADIEKMLTRMASNYALSTHRINSTSNVQVELELAIRHEWVTVYNLVTTGNIFG